VVDLAERMKVREVDLTGGAPELHPKICDLIRDLRVKGLVVKLRTNLTALLLPETEGMIHFLREHQVELVASLPCFGRENVDRQRGDGVFEQSIEALRQLNQVGYGSEIPLTLVYNPLGPSLPPDQRGLEADYRKQMKEKYGVIFTSLIALANVPIGAFKANLMRENGLEAYEQKLEEAFNPLTLEGLMCRQQLHINWNGEFSDCDFNSILGLHASVGKKGLYDGHLEGLHPRQLVVKNHCFTCTAGAGSSCGGALA